MSILGRERAGPLLDRRPLLALAWRVVEDDVDHPSLGLVEQDMAELVTDAHALDEPGLWARRRGAILDRGVQHHGGRADR